MERYQSLGERYGQAVTLDHIGDSRHAAGDPAAARAVWRRARAIYDELGRPEAAVIAGKLN